MRIGCGVPGAVGLDSQATSPQEPSKVPASSPNISFRVPLLVFVSIPLRRMLLSKIRATHSIGFSTHEQWCLFTSICNEFHFLLLPQTMKSPFHLAYLHRLLCLVRSYLKPQELCRILLNSDLEIRPLNRCLSPADPG